MKSITRVSKFFKFKGKHYYADLNTLPVNPMIDDSTFTECMIFEIKDGNVDWYELYCKRNIPVTKKELLRCIKEFCLEMGDYNAKEERS